MAQANQLTEEYKEFVESLNANRVEYLIVGAYAVARYGYVRATGDIDVWVNPTLENAQRVVNTLQQFGLGGLGYVPNDFIEPETIVQLGVAPLRIDLLTSVDGVEFNSCYDQREIKVLDGVPINFISLSDLRQNKASTGRLKDQLDLQNLSNYNSK
ncbi:nucleotidyltransferase [Hymenobacter radiodurans]|uniref:nucleotidyltransferase n=1 Tax=Hymenobacter radiodurans TaxID=2496028 RepID=UPI001058EB2C|nr:nucleotidyltransferase [Hymenobacter radiodurans]